MVFFLTAQGETNTLFVYTAICFGVFLALLIFYNFLLRRSVKPLKNMQLQINIIILANILVFALFFVLMEWLKNFFAITL